jgi:hypothetical protein
METMLIREFRADHQRITGSLLRLKQAILQVDVPQVRKILGGADTLLGAHFKFEELHLYPAVSSFIDDSGVQQLLREHDDIFRGVGELIALTSKASWSDADRDAALQSFGLVGDHPESCDALCRDVEQLPTSQQDALLERMQAIRRERPNFSEYAVARRVCMGRSRPHAEVS